MRTPSASSARPSRSATSRLVSRSSNKRRTRSRSSSALRSSSRLAWPRTISLRSALSPPDQLASPADTIFWVSASSSARLASSAFSTSVLRLGERPAADAGIEEVRGLGQRRDRQAERQRNDAVLDLPVLGDQHHQGALGLQPHELDMLEPDVALDRQHDAGRMGEAGQEAARLRVEHVLDRLTGGRDLALDGTAARSCSAEVADLHQRVDEEAQAELGRQPAGRGVRRIDQPELLQVLHDVADRGRRQRHGEQPGEVARAHRLAGRQVAVDDLAENLARALVERDEARLA